MVDNERCIICQVSSAEGITILDSFLCTDCEQEIVRTEVDDTRYTMFVSKLRELNLQRYTY